MGFAYADLHWTPETFWNSTLREVCTALAHKIPTDEINTNTPFFTDEEKQILNDIKTKVERDKRLANG